MEARRARGEAEKVESEEKTIAAHLVHQSGEGKRSGCESLVLDWLLY